jgi:hypothetical protein
MGLSEKGMCRHISHSKDHGRGLLADHVASAPTRDGQKVQDSFFPAGMEYGCRHPVWQLPGRWASGQGRSTWQPRYPSSGMYGPTAASCCVVAAGGQGKVPSGLHDDMPVA